MQLKSFAVLLSGFVALGGIGEAQIATDATVPQLRLLEDYPGKTLEDVSPDGNRMLFWLAKRRVQLFDLFSGTKSANTAGSMELIERRPVQRLLGSTAMSGFPRYARLLTQQSGGVWDEFGTGLELWKVRDGEPRSLCHSSYDKYSSTTILPVTDSEGIGSTRTSDVQFQLFRITLDDCTVRQAVIVDPEELNDSLFQTEISKDKSLVATLTRSREADNSRFWNVITVRRTSDLSVVQRFVDSYPIGFEKFRLSDDNSRLIVRCRDYRQKAEKEPVLIYDLRAGTLLKQLIVPKLGESVAISPDNRLVAAGTKRRGVGNNMWIPVLQVLDAETGAVLATAEYPELREPRSDPWIADIRRIFFLPDHSIAATTYDTKVWKLPEMVARADRINR